MLGLGTVVNVITVLAGGMLGLLLKKGISTKMQDSLVKALGLATMFIGISGALGGLLKVSGQSLDTKGSMLMIISLVIGTFIGEMCSLEDRLENVAEKLKKISKSKSDNTFVEGFVSEFVVICVGAMAIVGALEDGLSANSSTLFAKSALDFVTSVIFASTLGVGALFAVIPMVIYQGAITVFARFIEPFLSATNVVDDISYIGSVLIFAIGINLFFGKKVKCTNMLPALIVPVIYKAILLFV